MRVDVGTRVQVSEITGSETAEPSEHLAEIGAGFEAAFVGDLVDILFGIIAKHQASRTESLLMNRVDNGHPRFSAEDAFEVIRVVMNSPRNRRGANPFAVTPGNNGLNLLRNAGFDGRSCASESLPGVSDNADD